MITVARTAFVALGASDRRRAEEFYGGRVGLARNPHSSGERWVEYETNRYAPYPDGSLP